MKLKGSLIGFALITCLYLGLLIWLDARKQVFTHLPQLWQPLLAMMGMALASFMLRFARWQWLLSRLGHRPPLMNSFLAYLSGFVFTATLGKVGELVRIRYLSPAGVPPKDTIGVFVFERLFDLLAVLILAAFHTDRADLLAVALVFVLLVASIVFLCATHPSLLDKIINALRRLHVPRAAHWLQTLRDGLLHCRLLTTPSNALISLAAGLLAWLLLPCLCSSASSAEHPSSISDSIVPLSDCHAGGCRLDASGWHRLDRSHACLPADIRRSALGHGYSRRHMRPHRHTLVLDRSWIHLDRPALVSRREWRAISALNDLRKHLSTPELPLFTRTKHVIISTATLNHERTSLPDHSKPLPMPGLDASARLSGTRHHWGI